MWFSHTHLRAFFKLQLQIRSPLEQADFLAVDSAHVILRIMRLDLPIKYLKKDISVSDSLLYILGFYLLVSIISLGVYFDLVIYSMFQCTYWRLSCIFVDYSGVISLVWTTHGFYPCIKGFCTLNKLCLLCFFLISILRSIFIGASNRFLQVFGKFIFAAYYSIIKFIIVLTCSPHHFVYLTLCIFSLSSIRFCLFPIHCRTSKKVMYPTQNSFVSTKFKTKIKQTKKKMDT